MLPISIHCFQGNVSLWETSTGSLLKQLQLHAEPVTAICVFLDGMRVLSCDAAGFDNLLKHILHILCYR